MSAITLLVVALAALGGALAISMGEFTWRRCLAWLALLGVFGVAIAVALRVLP